MDRNTELSESFILYVLLAVSGGGMDAYSYMCRSHVFANAQTGNMLLLGVKLAEGDLPAALAYFFPILAFAAGIILSDIIKNCRRAPIHRRQLVLLAEILILFSVSFIPQSYNSAANALISFVCGLQLEGFRAVKGNAIATTMCMGNLRSGTHNLAAYFRTHQSEHIKRAGLYFGIIFFFIVGAVIEGALVGIFAEAALYFSVGVLLTAFCLMFRKSEV